MCLDGSSVRFGSVRFGSVRLLTIIIYNVDVTLYVTLYVLLPFTGLKV
jgi:hypothetical protein